MKKMGVCGLFQAAIKTASSTRRVKDTSEHESWTDETEGADLSKQIPVPWKKEILFSSITYSFIHSEKIERKIDGDDRMYAIIFAMILSLKGKT